MSGCSPEYKLESIVSINSKGQIVLPKTLRERAGFEPKSKLAIVTFNKKDEVCFIILKAENLKL